MADSCASFDNRNRGFLSNEIDEAFAAARNDEVNIPVGVQQFSCCLMGGGKQRDGILIDAEVFEHGLDDSDDGAVAIVSILPSFQNTGASGLEA